MKVRAVKSVDRIKEGSVYEIDWTVQEDITLKGFQGVYKWDCFMFLGCDQIHPDTDEEEWLLKYLESVEKRDAVGVLRCEHELTYHSGTERLGSYVVLPILEDGSVKESARCIIRDNRIYQCRPSTLRHEPGETVIASGDVFDFTPCMLKAFNICQQARLDSESVQAPLDEMEELAKRILEAVPPAMWMKYNDPDVIKALRVACEFMGV